MRQSFGVCKLYTRNDEEIIFQEKNIYLFNILFLFVAFFRFYYPVFENINLLVLNLIVLFLISLTSFFYISKYKFSKNFLTFLTGILIFYPTCFVNNPVHAIIMGVTMHYTQYLYFTRHVVSSRINENNLKNKTKNSFYLNYFFVIIIYSIIMTFFSNFGKSANINFYSLIIIPITAQMLHFYLDSQLWKFSIKHNRDNVLKYILNIVR